MNQNTYSLRKKIFLRISVPTLIVSVVTIVSAFFINWHEIEEVYDSQLVHSAKVLLQLTEHEILQDDDDGDFSLGGENYKLQHSYEKKIAFRIWHKDNLITRSLNAEKFAGLQAPPGFSDQAVNGEPWRFFVFIDAVNNIKIETSESYGIRYELLRKLMAALTIPGLIFIPLIFFIVWRGVSASLKAVVDLSGEVDSRNSDDLSVIQRKTLPKEVAPLIQAINRLFERMQDSFKREREFTDHAAHELRTPLAAMKIQAQVLLKHSINQANTLIDDNKQGLDKKEAYEQGVQQGAFQEGLQDLLGSVDRATHLVDQLLSLARLQNASLQQSNVNITECIDDCVDDCKSFAQKKNISLNANVVDKVLIQGHSASLAIMVRNLLDNAIKYTPSGGAVSVSLSKEGLFAITDTGSGLSDTDKQKVFERFVRLDKSGNSGSGLGLAIAKWIADAHHLTIKLADNAPEGLTVNINFRALLNV